MSSSEFSAIRRRSQAGSRITSLVRAFQSYTASQYQLENPQFRSINRPVLSRLKYHDKFLSSVVQPANLVFYCPLEPDGDSVVMLSKLDHNGRYFMDGSGFGNHIDCIGNPVLKSGIDNGYGQTIYAVFDNENRGYLEDNPRINSEAYRNGMSLFCRIYPEDISLANGTKRTVFSKHDSTDGTSGYALTVDQNGQAQFTIWRAGTGYSVVSGNVIIPGVQGDIVKPYEIAITVAMNGVGVPTTLKMYVDNVGYTTTTTNHIALYNGDGYKALRLGCLYPYISDRALTKWAGGIQDFRIYRDKVLTDAEVANLFNNKVTISAIPKGKIAIAGMGVFDTQVHYYGGFSEFGFSSKGFNTTPMQGHHSLLFNRINREYFNVDYNAAYDNLSQLSISVWMKINSHTGIENTWPGIFNKWWQANGSIILCLDWRGQIIFGARNNTANYSDYAASDALMPIDTWLHVVGRITGSNIQLFVDGQLQIAGDPHTGTHTTGWGFSVGCSDANSAAHSFDGYLDDLRFYNVSLTDQEITDLYNGIDVTRGLVSNWKLDEGSGNIVHDYIRNLNGWFAIDHYPAWSTEVAPNNV